MLQFPFYFAVWIATGASGLIAGFIAVRRAERRARRLGAEAQLVHTEHVEAELVSAA